MTAKDYPALITISANISFTKDQAWFRELCRTAAPDAEAAGCAFTVDQLVEQVAAREALSPTAVGNGLLLPHIRIAGLRTLVTVFGRAKGQSDYPTPDGQPPRLACLLLIPEEHPVEGLRFMADLGGCIRSEEKCARLMNAASSDEIREVLAEQRDTTHTLIAADLMTPARFFATPKMELKEATRLMAHELQEVIPVLDNGELVGELRSAELFKLGIPDFFNQLKSVGFIRYFDPFEKYFAVEAASHVEDVMDRNFTVFPESATLIEIVFGISVRQLPLIYVTDNRKKLLGIISRARLLQRIINL